MTIGQARTLAIIISLAYIPAFIFGAVCIWMALMAASIVFTSNLHLIRTANLIEAISSDREKPVAALVSAVLISLENIAVASTPQLAVLVSSKSQGLANISIYQVSELLDSTFYDLATNLFAKIFIHKISYVALGLDERVLLHAVFFSILTFIALMFGSRRDSKRLFLSAAAETDKIVPKNYDRQMYLEYSFFKSGFGLCVAPCLAWLAWAFATECLTTGYFHSLHIADQLMLLTSTTALSHFLFFSISYSLACSYRGAHANRR